MKLLIFVARIVLLVLALASFGAKASQSMCTSKFTNELKACARENFEYSDKVLNLAYSDLSAKLSPIDKSVLLMAEKQWIAYKETSCQNAYIATYPGEEADIDKWTCLDEVTRARIEEINYLNTGIGAMGFYKATEIVPQLYEGGARDKFISKLIGIFSTSDDKIWRSYVENHCKLSISRTREDKSDCVARQVFYRY